MSKVSLHLLLKCWGEIDASRMSTQRYPPSPLLGFTLCVWGVLLFRPASHKFKSESFFFFFLWSKFTSSYISPLSTYSCGAGLNNIQERKRGILKLANIWVRTRNLRGKLFFTGQLKFCALFGLNTFNFFDLIHSMWNNSLIWKHVLISLKL